MFQQVLNYAGEYRKTTYLSIAVMLSGIIMNVLPFLFLYQLLRPLLTGEDVGPEYILARILAIAVCGVLRESWKDSPWASSRKRAPDP